MSEIALTVYLSTYNQAPYLREALDSIMMQKTNFAFEIVAADDCSTDGTQDIILQYQKQYPGRIIPFFTPQNVGGCKKFTDCLDAGLIRGDYIAPLEGDDYWLSDDRLQTLVDFLERNPRYSRVSHQREIVDENGVFQGFDIEQDVLDKPFYIEDFLRGKNYSDFGSVYRNYFREAGSRYHSLYHASRNVCDFQEMFITQDFGPVFVMDRCFSAYRSRSVAGGTNYNSITTTAQRSIDHIHICKAVEAFYDGKYDLSPMIHRMQQRLIAAAVFEQDAQKLSEYRSLMPDEVYFNALAELLYMAIRGRKKDPLHFISQSLTSAEKKALAAKESAYAAARLKRKVQGSPADAAIRGTVTVSSKKTAPSGEALTSIAFVIPYFGKLPNYFPAWLASCAANPTVDFFVFTDDQTPYSYPQNVKMIPMTFDEAKLLIRAHFDFEISLSFPYKLCDYRPVFGLAFSKWISGYDFWGHCDIDLIWGNIRKFFTEEILNKNDRVLWLGHCSLYRNNDHMNHAFKTLPSKGCMEWKNVYSTEQLMAFDEYAEHNGGGMSLIMERNNVPIYKEWVFADLCVGLDRFQCVMSENAYYGSDEESRSCFFRREADGLYLVYKRYGEQREKEVMYAHFQKRKIQLKCDFQTDGADRYLLLPPGTITSLSGNLTSSRVRRIMLKNDYRYLVHGLVNDAPLTKLAKRTARKLSRIFADR